MSTLTSLNVLRAHKPIFCVIPFPGRNSLRGRTSAVLPLTARALTGALLAAAPVLLGSVPAKAQEPPSANSVTMVHAGRLFDAPSGRMLDGQDILIRGNRIEQVGPRLSVPAGAHEINLRDATVLPGFIDVHTHLVGSNHAGYEALGVSVPRMTLSGVKNARVTLLAGFTTVRNVGAEGYSDVALRDAINEGDVTGPRMQVSGPPLGITGGHCDSNLLPFDFHYSAEGVANGVQLGGLGLSRGEE